jgi:hypothetical protein
VDWIDLAQDRDKWRALVKMEIRNVHLKASFVTLCMLICP